MSNVKLTFGPEARQQMQEGVDDLANAVKATLGPMGRNVVIRHPVTGKPYLTKDGVTVARVINFQDKTKDMGAQMIKMASEKTAIIAGDGTTTSAVLAQSLISGGMAYLINGANPVEMKRGMDKAVECVTGFLKQIATKVDDTSLVNVATISANNDPEIGKLVADAIIMAGEDGVVHIQETKDTKTTVQKVEGILLDKGYVTPALIANTQRNRIELTDTLIVITDRKVSTYKDVELLLKTAKDSKKSLLLIAEDIDGEALSTIIANKHAISVGAIRLPGFGNMQMQMLEDLAIMTGGKVVSPFAGDVLANIRKEHFGHAASVTVTATNTTIVGPKGDKKQISDQIQKVKDLLTTMSNEIEADKIRKQRLAKLSDGIVVINVGAHTEIEMREKKDRIDDAVCATKAAKEEGIVPGGGVSYIRSIDYLKELQGDNVDQEKGMLLVQASLYAPAKQILSNAGVGKIEDIILNIEKEESDHIGYNPKTGLFTDFISDGIIDPCKVTRAALENAASVASMFLTTECAIVEI